MRVAIIDLGTNSVRFDVHQLGPGNRVRQLHREKLMVRLGQGVFLDGKLDPAATRRTLQAFASFHKTAEALHTDKIIAFGTSALREAADGHKLLAQIKKRAGIDVRVISGAEEARLIALGVLTHEKPIQGRYALIDIGGGSTEISICRGLEVHEAESFPLGTARLQQVFLKSSPPKDVEPLRRYIRTLLLTKMVGEDWPKVDRLIGSSGTIRAVARLINRGKKSGAKHIDRGDLRKLIKTMRSMTTTQLLGLPGMEAKRVDMILAGAILLEECMDAVGAKKVITTEFSLRDGILEEQIQLVRQQKEARFDFRLPNLYAKAIQLGCEPKHIDQAVSLSEQLFTKLKPLHKLGSEWKPYLIAAAILHDVGEAVTPTAHEVHSYYIVKNADFPAMETWESEFVAQLCLRHRGGKVDRKHLPFEDKVKQTAFLKLLALLRVADALDRGHAGALTIRSIRTDRKAVRLSVSGKGPIDLELLRVEQKKDLFEEIFGRELITLRA